MSKFNRRSWGGWALYTSSPTSLGHKQGSGTYHVKLNDLSTEEKRKNWIKHISQKPWGEVCYFAEAIDALLAEGKIK